MRGIFGSLADGLERKSGADATTYGPPDIWLDLFGSRTTKSGIPITYKRALEVTTALRCGQITAEGICSIPWKLYQRTTVKGRVERVERRDHDLWDLMSTGPNEWQTSFEFRETIGLHLAFCRNAYVFLNRVRGRIVEMIPFEPGNVTVSRDRNWKLTYKVCGPDGSSETFPSSVIWHIRGMSWNSWMGLEVIDLAREALGLALATEESHARLHDKAVRPSGVLAVEGNLDDTQYLRWRKWVDAYYSGRENAGKALILDRSAKWQSQQMTGVDAQHIQTRGFQIEEICRGFGILPIMVGYTGDKGATYASAEQMFIAHNTWHTRPWHRRLESSADKWLLTKEERGDGLYTGFVDSELVRGDMKTRFESYKSGVDAGWMLPEEPRAFEDMPYVEGLDRPRMPANYVVVGKDGLPSAPPPANTGA